jgi:hypothetical protein
LLPAAVAGGIVIVGWRVAEYYARRRETRNDLRAAVASFSEAIDEVRQAAVTFYGLAGNQPQAVSLSTAIKSKIAALSTHLAVLKDAGLNIDTVELLKRFRQSVTGGDFDSLARQALQPNSQALIKMASDGQELTRAVQTEMLRFLLPASRLKRWRVTNLQIGDVNPLKITCAALTILVMILMVLLFTTRR